MSEVWGCVVDLLMVIAVLAVIFLVIAGVSTAWHYGASVLP